MFKNFESPEFAVEISSRFGRVVITTHILQNELQFVRLPKNKVQGTGLYLLYKDVVDGEHSFWLGYEVIDEQGLEINFGKPLWLHITSKQEKDHYKVQNIDVLYIADLQNLSSHNEVPVSYEDVNGALELTKRCIYSVTHNINDFYSKSRISSFIKVITGFVKFKYDFSRTEVFSTDEDMKTSQELCLKTRYMPINLNIGKKTFGGVSVFVDNLKLGRTNCAVWYCAALEGSKVDTRNGFLALAETNKSLNVNNVPSSDSSFCGYDISEDFILGEKNVLNTKVQAWLSDAITSMKIKNIDVDSEIIKTFSKLDKQKDLFNENVLNNISFINLENFEKTPIINLPDKLINLSINPVETVDKAEEWHVPSEQTPVQDVNIQEYLEVHQIPEQQQAITLSEEFIEGCKYTIHDNQVQLTIDGYGAVIGYDKKLIQKNPNKAFCELINLRVDPFTLLQMFKEIGVVFNQYRYAELKEKIENASDDDLKRYLGFENYLGLVRKELYKRKNSKLVSG